jgi:hypothetical protein
VHLKNYPFAPLLCSSDSPAPHHGRALPQAPRRAAPHCVPTSSTSQQPRDRVARVVNDAVTSAPPPLPQHHPHARLAPHLARAHATITRKSMHARCCRTVARSPASLLCAHAAWAPHVALPRRPPHANHAPQESVPSSPQRHRRGRTTTSSPAPRHAAQWPPLLSSCELASPLPPTYKRPDGRSPPNHDALRPPPSPSQSSQRRRPSATAATACRRPSISLSGPSPLEVSKGIDRPRPPLSIPPLPGRRCALQPQCRRRSGPLAAPALLSSVLVRRRKRGWFCQKPPPQFISTRYPLSLVSFHQSPLNSSILYK